MPADASPPLDYRYRVGPRADVEVEPIRLARGSGRMTEPGPSPEIVAARPVSSRSALSVVASGLLFLLVFLFFWISVNPFIDLTDPTSQTPSESAGALNQAAVFVLAGLSAAGLALGAWRHAGSLAVPLFLAPLAWYLVTAGLSVEPSLSARRYVLTLLIIVQVVNALLMAGDRRIFSAYLAVSLLAVLLICYGGVALWPSHAVHSADEILEPMHAGHWRGSFLHKNAAGGAMALAVIVSIYVARTFNAAVGWLLGIASAIFLVATVSKTALALLPVSLLLSEILLRVPSPLVRGAIIASVLGLFGLLTVGSVILPPVHAILEVVSSDPTFTNRTEIWSYALSQLGARPLIGHGFEAFWRSGSVFYSASETFASQAANGHDGYVDILLTTGLPGLIISLGAFVVQPLRDLNRSLASGKDPATTAFFTRLWVFCLLTSFLESIFLNNTPGWFMFLLAVIGLRFLACARVIVAPSAEAAR